MPVTFDYSDSFCERIAKIVNSDHLSILVKIKVSGKQVSDAMEQLGLKLKHGRIRASDVFQLCSEIAAELDNRAGSCRGRKMCDVLKNVIERNCDILVWS
ncbi:MAG: hypothetical protein ACYTBV_19190 [Planctomycetota bacterium]